MSSRPIYEFHSAAVPAHSALPSRTSLATVVAISDSPAFVPTLESQNESEADGLGCARGIRAAFMLEGGIALLVYGIWHLWHVIR